jgi:hypothetical protein
MKEVFIQTVLAYRGELLAVLSIFVAIVIYIRSRRFKGASYFIETSHVTGGKQRRFRGLEIFYNGNRIESCSASKVLLWNRGSEAIRGTDIAPAAPLVISIRDPEFVLDHQVLYCSSPHSRVSTMSREDGSILIGFDYLDPRQGVILEVLHTGGPSSIFLSGSVIDGGEIQTKESPGEKYALALTLVMYLIIAAISILSFAGIFTIFRDFSGWFKVSMGLAAFSISVFLVQKLFLPLLDGGFMVEKLSNGYAKQEKAGASSAEGD